jgi:hypothetical protein
MSTGSAAKWDAKAVCDHRDTGVRLLVPNAASLLAFKHAGSDRGAVSMVQRTTKPGGSRPGREKPQTGSKGILTRVNSEGLRTLKMLAIERDTTLQALAVEAFNDLLAKYGKRSVVRNPLLLDE